MIAAPFRILIVAALGLVTLIGMVVREGAAREAGTEVMLPMEPVDPRALLSGHYVAITLSETLPEGERCPSGLDADHAWQWDHSGAREEWIALGPAGDHHRAIASFDTRPSATDAGTLLVRGNASCTEPEQFAGVDGAITQPSVIRAGLGIERFYINQTDALRIEAIMRDGATPETRVYAIASIGEDGRARLKGLLVDGERLNLDWF